MKEKVLDFEKSMIIAKQFMEVFNAFANSSEPKYILSSAIPEDWSYIKAYRWKPKEKLLTIKFLNGLEEHSYLPKIWESKYSTALLPTQEEICKVSPPFYFNDDDILIEAFSEDDLCYLDEDTIKNGVVVVDNLFINTYFLEWKNQVFKMNILDSPEIIGFSTEYVDERHLTCFMSTNKDKTVMVFVFDVVEMKVKEIISIYSINAKRIVREANKETLDNIKNIIQEQN